VNHWHLITPEFPPDFGGVADYSKQIAQGLHASGDVTEVWCPGKSGPADASYVHRELGSLGPGDLQSFNRRLNEYPAPRRLLVQWVPHGYGWNSMNVAFCIWLLHRSLLGDSIDLMIHEPFLSFREGSIKQDLAAIVHRLMILTWLAASKRIWVSIPAWKRALRPYLFKRTAVIEWLPVPNNIPVSRDTAETARIRSTLSEGGACIIGHFGSFGKTMAELLKGILPRVLHANRNRIALLMGRNSDKFRTEFVQEFPALHRRVVATGLLEASALSCHFGACDVLVQPYPDGVSSRRTTIMTALAHGVPTVTNIGRLSESFWADCGALDLSPTHKAESIAEAVERLLANPKRKTDLRDRAYAFYESNFALQRIIERLRAQAA